MQSLKNKYKRHLEDYATALFGDRKVIVCVEESIDDRKINLVAYRNENSQTLLSYDFGSIHSVDETDGVHSFNFLQDKPIMACTVSLIDVSMEGFEKAIVHATSLHLIFVRYCNLYSIEYILSTTPFSVVDMGSPDADYSKMIVSEAWSTKYLKIEISPIFNIRVATIYLADGNMLDEVIVDNIEEE